MLATVVILGRIILYIVLWILLNFWMATAIAAGYYVISLVIFRFVLGLREMEAWGAVVLLRDPGNSLVITTYAVFDRAPIEMIYRFYEKVTSLPGTETMRYRAIRALGNVYWVLQKDFNLSHHIGYYTKRPIHTRKQIVDATAEEMMVPLPEHRPLWQVLFIPDYNEAENASAIIYKISHAVGDGMSISTFFLQNFSSPAVLYKNLPHYPWYYNLIIYGLFPVLVAYGACAVCSPEDSNELTYHNGRPMSGIRVAGHAGPYPLGAIREKCKREGITINDFVATVVVRSLRKYLEAYGKNPEALNDESIIHLDIPFTYRDRDSKMTLSIKIALLLVEYPLLKGEDRQGDLQRVARIMEKTKDKRCLFFANIVMATVERWIPPDLLAILAKQWSRTSSCVFTNVPGARNQLEFEGKKLREAHFLSPALGANPSAIGITTYNEELSMLVVSDLNRMTYPDKLAQFFDESMKFYMSD